MGAPASQKGGDACNGEVHPPFITSVMSFMLFSLVFLLGWIRDLFTGYKGTTKKVCVALTWER